MSIFFVLSLSLIGPAFAVLSPTLCYEELNRGSVFGAVPMFDNDLMSVAKCVDACPTMKPTFTFVALTNGNICLCGIVTSKKKKLSDFGSFFLSYILKIENMALNSDYWHRK
jgi:hypothetical protein